MTDPILKIRNLRVQFQTEGQLINAVDGISLTLPRGQTLGIVGESGSGKSVTSLSVMRLIPTPPGRIVDGEIWFQPSGEVDSDGSTPQHGRNTPVDLLQLPLSDMQAYRGSQISMIFQEPMSSLNPVYTCGFQIVEALRLHEDLSVATARRQAIALLQEVKLIPPDQELHQSVLEATSQSSASPSDSEIQKQVNQQKRSYLDRYPHQLSGGQIQRVMIAMAIASNPAILIADEPTTALDVTVQATILDLLRELRDRRQMSIIFVTHDLGIIAEIADTVAVMYQGQVVETGSTQEIFENPQHPYTRGLLACRPRPDQRLKRLPTVADFMVTEPPTAQNPLPAADPSPSAPPLPASSSLEISTLEMQERLTTLTQQMPLLSVKNLQVFFPVKGMFGKTARYVTAVNDMSFDVYPGETLGLVGESGCGKTTLGRTLVRLNKPTSGNILFAGRDITQLKGRNLRKLRQNLQIIFQDPYSSLDPRMNVGSAIMEPMRIAGGMGDRIAQDRGGTTPRDRAAYLLERVGLKSDDMNRYPHEFSGGQRQRICIARALALNPKFIICDESVSALDVSVQAQVLNLLKELQREFDLTYIFISHDLSVVKFMSDRIMVMNRGKLEEIGAADQIYHHPEAEYTRKLIDSIPVGLPTQPKSA